MTSALPMVVAGAGIGGLATALALARVGFDVRVLEKSATLGELGAGIQLGPNAFHAFDRLGVGSEARSMAVFIDQLRLMDAMTGDEITHIDIGERFRTRFGNPYAVVHRGDLHGVLLNACRKRPRVTLTGGAEVVSYSQTRDSVTVALASGATIEASLLIGADGLWSKIRRQLIGDGAPRISGHTCYRSVIPTEAMPEDLRWNAATLWAGPKCHIVHYPLSDWKCFNFVATCHNEATEAVAGKAVTRDEVMQGFAHICARARRIIEHGSDWKMWVLCDREPNDNWVDGRVALLGDAAHPMLQYFAQGACMALEDAVCLADVLGAPAGDGHLALLEYKRRRLLRTARVQIESRAIGEHIYHPSGVHAQTRNAVMRAKSSEDYYDSLAWLYGGTGVEDAKPPGRGSNAIHP